MSDRRMKQVDLANAVGVSHQVVNLWVNGKTIPRMDKIQRIADLFGVDKSELLDEKKESQDELSATELQLVNLFREIDPSEQTKLMTYLRVLSDMRRS